MTTNLHQLNNRVLIIDDNHAIHEDFKKILTCTATEPALEDICQELFGGVVSRKGSDFQLDSAYQGQEGLELVRRAIADERPYGVAFVDVRMPPGWDGVETIARIWEIDADIQVVMCTAYSDHSWLAMMEKLGHSDRLVVLKKPFDAIEALQLAHTLSKKWQLLRATERKMDELEEIVHARTLHLKQANEKLQREVDLRKRREHCLRLEQRVTSLLAEFSGSAERLTGKLLEVLCEGMQWDVAQVWMLEQHNNCLRANACWHREGEALSAFEASNRQVRFSSGEGLIGGVWEKGKARWIGDIFGEAGFARRLEAERAGLQSAFAFPLRVQGKFLGIIELLSTSVRQPEEDLLELFGSIGSLIGEALERRALEEYLRQSQKMEAIGQLAGGVAHDFNNMLMVIQGFVEILTLQANDLSENVNDGLGQIAQAAKRAANLTRQLLTFSRKQIPQPRTFDMNELIANVAKMLGRVIGEDIALTLNCAREAALVSADEDMLTQVLMNLSVNSRDAMPKGGQLAISTALTIVGPEDLARHPSAREGEFVCLTVTDSGCGISPEHLPRIFEPFYTTKEVGRGTGLGLSTVYGIVQQHRGWIEVESHVGVGTRFKIFLPRAKQIVTPIRSGSASDLPGGRETILLVEDEKPVRSVARIFLQRLGYKVIEAECGKRALEIWEKQGQEVDMVLTDMVMPGGISGRDLISNLQMRRPNLKYIYATGYDPFQEESNRDLVEGVNFLQKPYHTEKLARTIRNMLDRRWQDDVAIG